MSEAVNEDPVMLNVKVSEFWMNGNLEPPKEELGKVLGATMP